MPHPRRSKQSLIQRSKVAFESADKKRVLTGFWHYFCILLGVSMPLFYFYNAGIAPFDTQYHRGFYFLVTFVLIFLTYPMRKKSPLTRPSMLDIALALLATAAVGYWIVEFEQLNYRMGSENNFDTIASIIGIFLSLEAARRVMGWSMTMVGVFFLAFCFWGDLLENIPILDAFSHDGFSFKWALNHIYLKQDGVFGIMVDVLATYVILFIFFGSFLKASGCAQFFLDLPMALFGQATGGPAKVAVVASMFFGSVSGSAIANTVSTGTFTIPLMKKAGFRSHVAGAIEPSASIGGMFMPPIMGAGAFLMAELTGISYFHIMKVALFPAVIYFLSVFTMVHFEAMRYGLVDIHENKGPGAWQIFKRQWFMSVPLVIIVVIMIYGYSPGYAAFWATISCVVVSWLTPDHKMGPKEILRALADGTHNTLIVGSVMGVIGIIVSSISLTGIGLKLSAIIIDLSHGTLPLAILLVGLASLVLGMAAPVTAAYLITAVLAVGALSEMISQAHFGISYQELIITKNLSEYAGWVLIASHMIIYWFSQDSNITPPVCVAAYAGAAIAGSDPWKTGWTSFKFAKMLYVGPFLFAFEPGFLQAGGWLEILMTYLTITLGTIAFSSLTMGYFLCPTNIVEWVASAVATILLFFPQLISSLTRVNIPTIVIDCIGIGIWIGVYYMQKMRIRKDPKLTLPYHRRKKNTETMV